MIIENYNLFPSIISQITCDNYESIKTDLIDWIYNYANGKSGPVVSNRGGWQSYNDFFVDETFKPFLNYIQSHLDTCLNFYNLNFEATEMWININRKGDYNATHHHHRILSGVLWVTAPENCGNMNFTSPNSYSDAMLLRNVDEEFSERYNFWESYSFVPKEGDMLIFPASMNHSVGVSESDDDRISITFNLDAR